MKKLIIFTLAVTAISLNANVDVFADQVIHNYKSVPLKISGRQPGGKLCLWNKQSKKWACKETNVIPTGGIAILKNVHNSPAIKKGGWMHPLGDQFKSTILYKSGNRGYGHAIVTDVGEVELTDKL